MEQTLSIILTFINEATPGLEAAAMQAKGAFAGMAEGAMIASTGMTSALGGAVSKVGGFVGGLIKQSQLASMFFGTAAVAMVGELVNMTASAEQARIAFENLLKSPEQAGQLLDWLTKYSIQTPVTRKELQSLAQTFLAYGATLGETKLAVQAVTEASSALGVNQTRLNTITYNLGQLYNSTTGSYRQLRDLQKEGISTSKLLANAVNDGKLKFDAYSGSAGGAGGATKAMTTAFNNASGNIQVYQEKVKLAQMRLDDYSKSNKKSETGTLSHTIALQSAQKTLEKANTAISTYTSAQSHAAVAVVAHTTNLKQLTREQEDSILKMNGGKDVAKALEEEMLKLYGGSALKQVQTFSGMLSNIPDILQYISQKILGLDSAGNILKGGLFEKLKNIIADFLQFLLTHVDDISNFFNKFLNSTPGIMTLVGIFSGLLIPALWGILAPLILLGVTFGTLGYLVGILIQKMGGLGAISKDLKPVFDTLGNGMKFIEGHKDIFIGAIGGIASALLIVLVPAMVQAGAKALQTAGQFALAWIMAVGPIGWLIIGIGALIGILVAVVITHWSQIVSFTQWLASQLVTFFTVTIPSAFNSFVAMVGGFVMSIVNFFANLPGQIMAFITDLFINKIPFAIGFMIGWVMVQLPMLGVMMVMWIVDTGTKLITEVSTWPGRFVNWLVNLGIQALAWLTVFVVGFVNGIMNIGTGSVNEVSTWPKRIMQWLNKLPGEITTWLKELGGAFSNGLNSIWKTFQGWGGDIVKVANDIKSAIEGALSAMAKAMGKGFKLGSGLSFAHGGIVPGALGQPVPILAHGGERIIPLSGDPGGGGGGGATINFYGGVTVDSEDRVKELADQIIKMLGRQSELARYGLG